MNQFTLNVVKGVTISPPVIGRITMGHSKVTQKDGGTRTLPVRDDHFGITTLVQNKVDRTWEPHPVEASLKKANEKLVAIPVTIAYNDVNLNLKNCYSAFDSKSGRVLCSGNGEKARRSTDAGVQDIDCPRPDACQYGQAQRCKSMSRAYFRIEGSEDELGVFVLRTTSWNSLSTLGTRLSQLNGLTQGKIAGMPMMLVMKGKTSVASFREVFYFADLVTRPGQTLLQAVKQAKEFQDGMEQAGLSIEGMESALRAGLSNGDFADEIEDVDEWVSDEELNDGAESGVSPSLVGTSLETLTKNLQSLVKASKRKPKDEPEAAPQSSVTTLVIASTEQPQAAVESPTAPMEAPVPVNKPAAMVKPAKTIQPARIMF